MVWWLRRFWGRRGLQKKNESSGGGKSARCVWLARKVNCVSV